MRPQLFKKKLLEFQRDSLCPSFSVSLSPKLLILKVELAGSKEALHKLPSGACVSPILTTPEPPTWVSKKGLEVPDKCISYIVTQPCSYRYLCVGGGGWLVCAFM